MIRTVRALAVLAALAAPLAAAEPVVAEVDGQAITVRQLEDALLKKEGAELAQDWLQRRLDAVDWASLADDDVLIEIAGQKLTRKQMAGALVQQKGDRARQELVEITVVEQALRKEGIIVTAALIDAEWARMERRFQAEQEGRSERVDFATWIRTKERMTAEQFRAQSGFRVLAGIHALVAKRARAEVGDDSLRKRFERNPERYRQHEGVDLQVIFLPWRTVPGPGGKQLVTPEERERLASVAGGIWGSIARGEVPFERAWAAFGKSWDPEAGANGRIGWVTRDGKRPQPGSRAVAREAMERAWEVTAGFPALLPPVAANDGMWMVRVLGRRGERAPEFEAVKDRVFDDVLDDELEARTKAMLGELRRAARVTYRNLPIPGLAAPAAPATAAATP